jgi:hypothetical protein
MKYNYYQMYSWFQDVGFVTGLRLPMFEEHSGAPKKISAFFFTSGPVIPLEDLNGGEGKRR